ncbi:hypothetical protein LZ31DRAFT_555186 [Colletotrichum somersetense]|nr:hypothetical protein LZ31DRAFT_555186 [Colletotrichum somersetense]
MTGALGSATAVILECLLRNARRCDSVFGPAKWVLAGWPPEPWCMITEFLALAWAGLWVRYMARAGFRVTSPAAGTMEKQHDSGRGPRPSTDRHALWHGVRA